MDEALTTAIDDRPSAYLAGACNIGGAEIAQRQRIGLIQLAVVVAVGAALLALDTPPWTRIVIWPLLAAAFVTLEQVRRRFCVAFGFAGLRNFGRLGQAERIEDADARATDRRAALVMVTYCALAAAAVTAVFVAIPG